MANCGSFMRDPMLCTSSAHWYRLHASLLTSGGSPGPDVVVDGVLRSCSAVKYQRSSFRRSRVLIGPPAAVAGALSELEGPWFWWWFAPRSMGVFQWNISCKNLGFFQGFREEKWRKKPKKLFSNVDDVIHIDSTGKLPNDFPHCFSLSDSPLAAAGTSPTHLVTVRRKSVGVSALQKNVKRNFKRGSRVHVFPAYLFHVSSPVFLVRRDQKSVIFSLAFLTGKFSASQKEKFPGRKTFPFSLHTAPVSPGDAFRGMLFFPVEWAINFFWTSHGKSEECDGLSEVATLGDCREEWGGLCGMRDQRRREFTKMFCFSGARTPWSWRCWKNWSQQ